MAKINYDQATKTAEKLLRIGTLSYGQISYASGIPLWGIREIQTDMNMERRRLMKKLRDTMLKIGDGIRRISTREEKLHDLFIEFIEVSQALIYGREITEEERDDLMEFICDVDVCDLDEFLEDFICKPEDSEVKLLTRAYGVTHTVYSEMLIKYYDAERPEQEDGEPDDYKEDEDEPDINSQDYVIPKEKKPADDTPGDEWEV